MVCNRCILVVKGIVQKAGISPISVRLGSVTMDSSPTEQQLASIQSGLAEVGFEILTDQKLKIVEKIKNTIVKEIQDETSENNNNFSGILSSSLNRDYSYLSKLFSEAEGVTIEKYIIDQKIEKIKELLAYGELNLSEIAFRLKYSSVAHLSAQFKKVTGFTPSEFRKLKDHHRRSLDDI